MLHVSARGRSAGRLRGDLSVEDASGRKCDQGSAYEVLALQVELCLPRLIASRAEPRWRLLGFQPGSGRRHRGRPRPELLPPRAGAIPNNLRGHASDNGRWARGLARAVRSSKILVVSIQTGSNVAQLTDEASQQLRGRLLAAGLESLSDQFADVEVGAIVRLDQADKRPLLDVVELWVGRTGEEQLSSTGILQLREGLRSDLGDGF